jgi:hypothetical protein
MKGRIDFVDSVGVDSVRLVGYKMSVRWGVLFDNFEKLRGGWHVILSGVGKEVAWGKRLSGERG